MTTQMPQDYRSYAAMAADPRQFRRNRGRKLSLGCRSPLSRSKVLFFHFGTERREERGFIGGDWLFTFYPKFSASLP